MTSLNRGFQADICCMKHYRYATLRLTIPLTPPQNMTFFQDNWMLPAVVSDAPQTPVCRQRSVQSDSSPTSMLVPMPAVISIPNEQHRSANVGWAITFFISILHKSYSGLKSLDCFQNGKS